MQKYKTLSSIIAATSLIFSSLYFPVNFYAQAESSPCTDLKIIFARGSGEAQNEGTNYSSWKKSLEEKLINTSLTFNFIDLDYLAIGIDNLEISFGAYFGSGDSYAFGESIAGGVQKLTSIINDDSCPNTKYVIGGYSQGAIVITKSLSQISPEKIIYAATFGDPKLYLPEGAGLIPDACKNQNLSNYRIYVPDCYAYEGLLGGINPYQTEEYIDKLGTWCNKSDIFCSSYLNISDHLSYVENELYEDAAKIIYNKIIDFFNLDNKLISLHNTAILIDSTGSMSSLIDKYKAEALRLAKATLDSGGRVALYDYRDLSDPYEPVEHCSFETCTIELFESELNNIKAENGGDTPESLLSAAFKVMKEQTWQYGATKSLVVLTDANFLIPDRDGITMEQVVQLSKIIDPVNFYIITNNKYAKDYQNLTSATDGKIFTDFNTLELSTNFIMARFDSLPKVIESETSLEERSTIKNINLKTTYNSASLTFETNADRTLIILNDLPLGFTTNTIISLDNLDSSKENILRLVPYKNDLRGIATEIPIILPAQEASPLTPTATSTTTSEESPKIFVPKAPNTGQPSHSVL